jgi:uncharacterized protein (DUF1330 family)
MSDTNTPVAETTPAVDKDIFYKVLHGLAHDKPPEVTAPEAAPATTPAPAPAEKVEEAPVVKKKKATIREPEPAPAPAPTPAPVDTGKQVQELVDQAIARRIPAQEAPPPAPLPADLTEEEAEEIELARFTEQTDPARAGLADQVLAFHVANKKFIEQALENDPDFDPNTDPAYKKFLAKSEPKFSASDKRKALIRREAEAAELRAAERIRRELAPEIEANRAQLREIQVRPDVVKRVNDLSSSLFADVEDEAFKAFATKGDAAAEDFPIEAEILGAEKQKTLRLAEEFLAIRNGLKPFSANENQAHKEIGDFITAQGDAFLKHGGRHLIRDGKQFVHPSQWKASMANTHWTFSNDDVVNALQVEATRKAQNRIKAEHAKIEKAVAARAKRAAPAPVSAPAAPTEEASPRAVAASTTSAKPKASWEVVNSLLGR